MELLDTNDFHLSENEFLILEKLSYKLEKQESVRVWAGHNNVYNEKYIFSNLDEATSVHQIINLLDKKSEAGHIILRSVDIELKFPYQLDFCLIESKRSFRIFKSSLKSIKSIYTVKGIDQTKLINLLNDQLFFFESAYIKINTSSNNCIVTLIDESDQFNAKDFIDLIKALKM